MGEGMRVAHGLPHLGIHAFGSVVQQFALEAADGAVRLQLLVQSSTYPTGVTAAPESQFAIRVPITMADPSSEIAAAAREIKSGATFGRGRGAEHFHDFIPQLGRHNL